MISGEQRDNGRARIALTIFASLGYRAPSRAGELRMEPLPAARSLLWVAEGFLLLRLSLS